MTRKITNTDLTRASLNVPNKFTVKEAANHDEMFKRNYPATVWEWRKS